MNSPLPLEGLRVVVTRPKVRAAELVAGLRARGATPILFPAIEITPTKDLERLDQALAELPAYQWLVFTSVNSVALTWQRMAAIDLDPQSHPSLRVAAIGPATAAALRERGVEPDFVPQVFIGESVGRELPDAAGARVLLPRAAGARPALPRILRARGATVDEIPIYRAVAATPRPESLDDLRQGVAALTFTSPSTVQHFVFILRHAGLDPLALPGDPVVACIGPVTTAAAQGHGYRGIIEAEQYTAEGLLRLLEEHFTEHVS